MNLLPAFKMRRAASIAALCALPLGAVAASPAATATEPAASQPAGPTASSRMASKCASMSGDERKACDKDVRHAAKMHGAKTHAHAASAAGTR